MINNVKVGQYIKKLRKENGYTEASLSKELNISFQAISKWETGKSLPDAHMLYELASVLNTTTDKILSGGELLIRNNKRINISNIIDGLNALQNLRYYFGENSSFYLGAIEGINKKMNIDFEEYIKNESYKETFVGEVIIEYLQNGYSIEKEDIQNNIKRESLKNIIYKYMNADK
ncbi:MAG: helix-turn-helix domain-containing protein [Acholeplasmatales bacterium]|jgi:transcriptional regulator with XRE-family HTH domain|nr:helix-turn-helix domain-containing protein [Acholeplasmatales bacterium]